MRLGLFGYFLEPDLSNQSLHHNTLEMIDRNRVFEHLINRHLSIALCLWLIEAQTREEVSWCTLWFTNILDHINSYGREEKWRTLTMLLKLPVLDSMFQTRLMWRLFITLGQWKVDIHQNETEVCPSSSETCGWTLEASTSAWEQFHRAY